MKFEGYKCDVCGQERGQYNHWLMAPHSDSGFTIIPWSEPNVDAQGIKHLCGLTCASKLLSQTVQGWSDAVADVPDRAQEVKSRFGKQP